MGACRLFVVFPRETMRILILLVVPLLLTACEKTVDQSQLVVRKDLHYQINNNAPYSGKVSSQHENGQIQLTGAYKNGLKEGVFNQYFENGQLRTTANFFMGLSHES